MLHFFQRYPALAWMIGADLSHRGAVGLEYATYRDIGARGVYHAALAYSHVITPVAALLAVLVTAQILFRLDDRLRYRALFQAHPVGIGWAGFLCLQALVNGLSFFISSLHQRQALPINAVVWVVYYVAWRRARRWAESQPLPLA